MKKIKKIIGIGGLVSALLLGGAHLRYKAIINDLNGCLPKRIRLQEETIGIKHFGTPKLELRYPLNEKLIKRATFFLIGAASYAHDKETIYYPPATVPNLILGNPLSTIDHELGHYYRDKLYEHIFNKDANFLTWGESYISEGIAEYFKLKVDESRKVNQDYGDNFRFVEPIIDLYGQKGIEFLIMNPPKREEVEYNGLFIRLKNRDSLQKKYLEQLTNLK